VIKYKEGYRYQLTQLYELQTPVLPEGMIVHDFFTLYPNGVLSIQRGYAWDGASGPTWDTKSSMRPSLVHDCFCQLMKERLLNYEAWGPVVHEFFRKLCIEDGMNPMRAAIWKAGVVFGRGGDPAIPDVVIEQEAP
jgi:hypothetical protein